MANVIARSALTGLAKHVSKLGLTSTSSLAMASPKSSVRTVHAGAPFLAKDNADQHDDHERLKNVPETITVHFVTKDGA